jgi:hypothetical protein
MLMSQPMGGDAFFVTVLNGRKVGWLAGPFNCRSIADQYVKRCRRMAGGDDPNNQAWWYGYGVTKVDESVEYDNIRVIFPEVGS